MRLLVAAAALFLTLAACAGQRADPRRAPPENAGLGAITAVTMQKTACNGTCPEYTVRFTADDRATYRGGRFAPLQGKFSGTVDFASLAEWVATQHPEVLKDRYNVAQDSQMVTLTVDRGARRQTIMSSSGLGPDIPLRLDGILLAIDGETTRIRWRRDDAATSFLGMFANEAADYERRPYAVDIVQSVTGDFYVSGPSMRCGRTRATLTRAGHAMRLRCGILSSVLRATVDGFRADGDAVPNGIYHRASWNGVSVIWGSQLEPRTTE